MTRARAIATGVGWTLLARAGSIAAALASQVVLAHALGPEGNGLIAGAASVLALAMLLADLGLNTSVSRLVARAYYEAPGDVRRVLRAGFLAKVGLTTVVGGAMWLGAPAIARVLGGGAALVPVLAASALQLVLDNMATFSFRGLQGLHLAARNAAAQAVSGIGSPMGAILFVIAGGGAAGAVLGRAAGAGLAALVGLAWLVRAVGRGHAAPAPTPAPAAPSPGVAREIAGYAGRIVWVQIAYLVFFRVDRALVFTFLGEREAGLYAIPASIVEQCLLFAVSLATVTAPYFAGIGDPERRPFLERLVARSLRVTALAYAPAAAGLLVLAPDAVRVVFGEEFAGSVPIVRLFAPALVVLAYATLLGQMLDYMGLARSRALAFGAAAAVDLAANVVLIPRLGAAGAVVALLATFAPLVAFYTTSLLRRVGARSPIRDLGRAVAGAAAMAGALAFVRGRLAHVGPLELALLVLGGAALYAVLVVRREDLRS